MPSQPDFNGMAIIPGGIIIRPELYFFLQWRNSMEYGKSKNLMLRGIVVENITLNISTISFTGPLCSLMGNLNSRWN